LQAIFDLLPYCDTIADIGTDHGKLGCALLKADKCRRAWFTDLSAPSLSKARALAGKLDLSDRAEFFVGDGCAALSCAPDAAVIAGMGGGTIIHILENGLNKLQHSCLVLGAQSELVQLREFLCRNGFRIADEAVVREGDKLYVLIKAENGAEELSEAQLAAGPRLMEKRVGLTLEYYANMYKKAEFALNCAKKANKTDINKLETEAALWKSLL